MIERLIRHAVPVLLLTMHIPLEAVAQTPSPTPQPPSVAESGSSQKDNTFAPRSAEEAAVQNRITIYNATQEALDASFDKKLSICRGC